MNKREKSKQESFPCGQKWTNLHIVVYTWKCSNVKSKTPNDLWFSFKFLN